MYLMTCDDVEERLAAGEDPIALTVEHWEENLAYVLSGEELPRESWDGEVCPLCITSSTCSSCPLGKTYGRCSSNAYNAWNIFYYANDDEEAIAAIRYLLEQLRSLEDHE